MSEYCKNCYKLQTKLDEVNELLLKIANPQKTLEFQEELYCVYKALEIINDKNVKFKGVENE